ncbi:MAG: hypothetical protein IKU45_06215 [Clostridia bacterium]|nr:hypothetical protein [Clostridia bacterium]
MKNFAKLFVAAFIVALVAALFAMSASATAGMTDPNTLKPGSEDVVFIMDPAEDGTLPGDGSGLEPENPLEALDHESFDPDVDAPKMYLQTELYQATEMLAKTGGTIVIMGPVKIGIDETYGSGSTTRDLFTAQFGKNTIKFTSVWNGVDYRETNGAKIILETPAEIGVHGQSIWENIDIVTRDTNRVISFNFWPTLVGEGVRCYPEDEMFEGVAPNYISLSAGHRYAGGVDKTTSLVVKSGSYNIIAGGEWGVNNTRKYNTEDDPNSGIKSTNNMDGASTVNLVLEGTTTVYGSVIGTCRQNAEFSGNVNLTINGGKYECDIYGVGHTGMGNKDGQVILKVNGGDFSTCWSLNDCVEGCSNNPPALSILDFSGWTGELSGIAQAYSIVTSFTRFKFPDGVTEDQVLAALPSGDETTAPSNDDVTEAPADEDDDAPAADDENNEENKKDDSAVDVGNNGGGNIGLIIAIIAGALILAGAAVAIVLILSKNKKK